MEDDNDKNWEWEGDYTQNAWDRLLFHWIPIVLGAVLAVAAIVWLIAHGGVPTAPPLF